MKPSDLIFERNNLTDDLRDINELSRAGGFVSEAIDALCEKIEQEKSFKEPDYRKVIGFYIKLACELRRAGEFGKAIDALEEAANELELRSLEFDDSDISDLTIAITNTHGSILGKSSRRKEDELRAFVARISDDIEKHAGYKLRNAGLLLTQRGTFRRYISESIALRKSSNRLPEKIDSLIMSINDLHEAHTKLKGGRKICIAHTLLHSAMAKSSLYDLLRRHGWRAREDQKITEKLRNLMEISIDEPGHLLESILSDLMIAIEQIALETREDLDLEASIYIELGKAHSLAASYDRSLEYFQQANRTYDERIKTDDLSKQSRNFYLDALYRSVNTAKKLEDWDLALTLVGRLISLRSEHQDRYRRAEAQCTRSFFLRRKLRFVEALDEFETALRICEDAKYGEGVEVYLDALRYKASLHRLMGNFDDALITLDSAVSRGGEQEILASSDDPQPTTHTHFYRIYDCLRDAYGTCKQIGRYSKANEYVVRSFNLSVAQRHGLRKIKALQNFASLLRNQGYVEGNRNLFEYALEKVFEAKNCFKHENLYRGVLIDILSTSIAVCRDGRLYEQGFKEIAEAEEILAEMEGEIGPQEIRFMNTKAAFLAQHFEEYNEEKSRDLALKAIGKVIVAYDRKSIRQDESFLVALNCYLEICGKFDLVDEANNAFRLIVNNSDKYETGEELAFAFYTISVMNLKRNRVDLAREYFENSRAIASRSHLARVQHDLNLLEERLF